MVCIDNYFNKYFTFFVIFTLIVCFNTLAYSNSYTKLDASGNDLPANATEWSMVRDNDRGLVWENKTDDGSIHDKDNTYTWYDSNTATNGGNSGIPGDGTDTEDFINSLNDQHFGGFDDWRMPTKDELMSIVEGTTPPTINTTYFSNTSSDYYWTSDTYSDNPSEARKVNFYNGSEGVHGKEGDYHARAVRYNTTTGPAPIAVTGNAIIITNTIVKLKGTVDPNGVSPTHYKFEFTKDQDYSPGAYCCNTELVTLVNEEVEVIINNLTPNTTYHYRIYAINLNGSTYGNDETFTTYGETNEPIVETLEAYNITDTTATLRGKVNPYMIATSYFFEYGTDTNYGELIPNPKEAIEPVAYYVERTADISGLQPNTTYHFRIVIITSDNVRKEGVDQTFITSPSIEPIAETLSVYNITDTTATLKGKVNPNGIATSYFFEYGTDINNLITTTVDFIGSGDEYVELDAEISGLQPNTTYLFRIVAINNITTNKIYGNVQNFFTSPTIEPIAETLSVYNITDTTATLKGKVNPNGIATSYFFEYGTDINNLITTTVDFIGSGDEYVELDAEISGLQPNTTYLFRIVAINNITTNKIYGNVQNFFTSPTIEPTVTTVSASDITETSVTLNGTYDSHKTPQDLSNVEAIYFEYGTTSDYGQISITTNSILVENIIQVTANITNLEPNKTYFYRLVVKVIDNNSVTNYYHGNNQAFTTLAAIEPTVTTVSARDITETSATLHGTYNTNRASQDLSNVQAKYFEYGTSTGYGEKIDINVDDENTISNNVYNFSAIIENLTPNTVYHFRLVVEVMDYNSVTKTYKGNDQTFTTSATIEPTVTTVSARDITETSATLHGTYNTNRASQDLSNVQAKYFEYGTSTDYGEKIDINVDDENTILNNVYNFSAIIENLTPNTVYHFRLVVEVKDYNSVIKTYKGNDQTFTTSATIEPTVTTVSARDITETSATLHGTYNTNRASQDLSNLQAKYFEYGTSTGYGEKIDINVDDENTILNNVYNFSAIIENLTPNTVYHFRLVVEVKDYNSVIKTYKGNYQTFTTSATIEPTVTTVSARDITETSATLHGTYNTNTASQDLSNLQAKYFEYGTSTDYGKRIDINVDDENTISNNVYNFSAIIENLTPNTVYHFRLVVEVMDYNSVTKTYKGNDQTFTTSATIEPKFNTGIATATETTAKLNGRLNPNGNATSYYFEYGTTASYGNVTPTASAGSGNINIDVSDNITGLSSNTTYHFRLVIKYNSEIKYGDDQTFTTKSNSGRIHFNLTNYAPNESGGDVKISVSRTDGNDGDVSVEFAIKRLSTTVGDKTALEGEDFTLPTETTLKWADGDNEDKEIIIQITDDSDVEGDETFEIQLTQPTDRSILGSPSETQITIIDDDIDPLKPGVIHFKQSKYEVDESATKITVSVVRSEGNEGIASVEYAVKQEIDSTATEGINGDFTFASGILTWEDGDSTDKTFDVMIHDDNEIERDERIILEIKNPTPVDIVTIKIPSQTIIVILDNDITSVVVDRKDVIDNTETEEELSNITDRLEEDIEFLDENISPEPSSDPSQDFVKGVDTAIDNIGETIKKSDELFGKGIIDVGDALKPLNLLDDVIEIGAETANSNGKIDIKNVAQSISKVKGLVETTSDSLNITGEHLRNIASRIDNIMNNMPNVTNAVKDTQDVKELLESIGGLGKYGMEEDSLGLTGSGIKTSLKIDINPADTIDTIGDIVKKGLEKAVDAGEIWNTENIVKIAGDIVEKSVQVLKDNDKEKKYIKSTLDQIQDELGEIVEQTTTNITNKSVKKNSFASTEEKENDNGDEGGSPSIKDFKKLMDRVAGLTKTVIQEKYALKSELTGKLQGLSHETMKNVLGYFTSRSQNKVGTKDDNSTSNDNSEIKDFNDFIEEKPQLLNELIEISSVNLTEGILVTQDYIDTVLENKENNLSFTDEEKTRLVSGLPKLPNFDQDIIESGRTELSLIDILNEELKTLLPGATVKANSMQGIYLNVMLKYSSDGIEFEMPLYIQDARVVSSAITEGLYLPPEGVIILVRNGIASIITPAPMDSVNTLLSADALLNIEKLFGSDNKEIKDVEINNSGNLKITFRDGSKFSGAFSYSITREGDGNFDAGTSSFEPQGTDPATEAYSVLVDYNDGYTQQLQPSVSALEQLVQVLDTLAAGSYTLDRETGILTVLGMKFKPSYLIEALTPDEAKAGGWFDQNQDSNGIAWEADDYNQDGAVDLKMWTDDGKQVIYTVIN